MNTAFLYSEKFSDFSYGVDHPMRPLRLRLTYELIRGCGLLDLPGASVVRARRATDEELLLFHTHEYIRILKEADSGAVPEGGAAFGLGYGDNPAFRGVFEWSSYSAGASVQAAGLVAGGKAEVAFNIAGGLHHVMPDRASGFCYLNDPVIAIKHLTGLGKRVAYVDIDAHHGDGVEAAFYSTDTVLTVSLHESGHYLFPGTGFPHNMGEGRGRGYAVNLPFPPGTGDTVFLRGFEEIVPPFIEAFRPDILVTQLGVDTFRTDPITHLNLTTNGFEAMVARFRSFGLPWVALGGGGYDMDNVKRAWTLAWAVMNGAEVPEGIRDEPPESSVAEDERLWSVVEDDVRFLKEEVLEIVKAE